MIKKMSKRIINKLLMLSMILGIIICFPLNVYANTSSGIPFATGLSFPTGIAFDGSGNLYAVNYSLNTVTKFDSDGNYLSNFGSGFSGPIGIAFDSSGNSYVTNNTGDSVMKFDPDGNYLNDLGTGFDSPTGIAIDSSGNIYVVDQGAHGVKKFDSHGNYMTILGTDFQLAYGIALDSYGNIYVADRTANAVKKMDSSGNNLLTIGTGYDRPSWVTLDSSGNIYVTSFFNGTIVKIDASGNLIATLGTGFDRPYATIFDNNENMYIADSGHDKIDKLVGVSTVPTIPDINVVNGTIKTAIGLPSNITVGLRDSSTTSAAITWDSGNPTYNGNIAGTYVFTGTLTLPPGVMNPSNYKASVNVIVGSASVITVPEIQNINVVNGTTQTAIGLPSNITVGLSNSSTTSAAITWDNGNPTYNGNIAGTYVFTGTLTLPLGVMNPSNYQASVNVVVPPGEGGSHTSKPSPGTTVIGSVIDDNGRQVSNLKATVTEDSNGNYAVSMKAAQTVMLKQPDGTMSPLSDLSKVTYVSAAGSSVNVSENGTINLLNLAKGTDDHFKITYDLGKGQTITIGTVEVTVSSSGAVSLTCTLIDPYGIITDAATGKPIAAAKVTLYYANTERNKTNGKNPETPVTLPGINGFKPNNNQNPQTSDGNGAYGFMVYPETDYYIVAGKEGYEQYTSPTISVGQEIVHWDFKMNMAINGVNRLAGQSRVDTALVIAKANYTGTLSNVILATADNYPDALAGSVLAYKLNAPILLVGSSEADQAKVLDYMTSNLAPSGTVYILGGTAVVSADMEAKVKADGFSRITRLGGTDRYETSVKIADQLKVTRGTPLVLAYGENYPDALSISSIAAEMQYPILLVQKDGLSDVVKNEIAAINPSKVYIIGGEGVIRSAVESQVEQIISLEKTNIVRIAGEDRYETSLAVAQYFNLSGQSVCIATGSNFPDALAGSVYAAIHNTSIILADGGLSDQVVNYLKDKRLTGATIFGGEAIVSKEIEQQLGQLTGK